MNPLITYTGSWACPLAPNSYTHYLEYNYHHHLHEAFPNSSLGAQVINCDCLFFSYLVDDEVVDPGFTFPIFPMPCRVPPTQPAFHSLSNLRKIHWVFVIDEVLPYMLGSSSEASMGKGQFSLRLLSSDVGTAPVATLERQPYFFLMAWNFTHWNKKKHEFGLFLHHSLPLWRPKPDCKWNLETWN